MQDSSTHPRVDAFIRTVVGCWFALDCLDGAIRFGLYQLGVPSLVYLREAMLLLAALAALLTYGVSVRMVALAIALVAGVCTGLFYLDNPMQVVFGLRTLFPLYAGFAIAAMPSPLWRNTRWIGIMFWVQLAGIALQYFIEYPWVGFNYDLGDYTINSSRLWWAGDGTVRLCGFARVSSGAASSLSITGIWLFALCRNRLVGWTFWVLTLVGLAATTSKVVIAAWFLVTALVITRHMLAHQYLARRVATSVVAYGVALAVIALPLLPVRIGDRMANTSIHWLTLSSIGDRAEDIWPQAWDIILNQGNPITGRGIGGIGMGMFYFEKEMYNPADNMFLFGYAQLGIIAAIFPFVLASQAIRGVDSTRIDHHAVALYLIIGIVTGITSNVLEGGTAAFFLCYGSCMHIPRAGSESPDEAVDSAYATAPARARRKVALPANA